MYEKMLNKQEVPSMEDLIAYCGANGALFQELNSYLTEEWNTQTLIRFPYGNSYGWGVKHSIKISLFFIQRYCPRHPCSCPGIFHEAGLSASLL